jgi:hypothetical protein
LQGTAVDELIGAYDPKRIKEEYRDWGLPDDFDTHE